MPNSLTSVLSASAAVTGAGTGAGVDIGDRSLVQVVLDVTAITTGASLSVTVETSATQSGWTMARRLTAASATGAQQVLVIDAERYVRVTWTLAGSGSPSATFAVTATSHQLYAEPQEISLYGIPAPALQGFPPEQIAMACLSASSEADGYLGLAFTLPITKWDTDLRRHVACMAVYDLLSARGFEPDSGKDMLIPMRRNDAIAWLKRISDGKLRPPGLTDSTPLRRETEGYVVSEAGRGWRR